VNSWHAAMHGMQGRRTGGWSIKIVSKEAKGLPYGNGLATRKPKGSERGEGKRGMRQVKCKCRHCDF
jgi:hypothetical protein